MKQRLVHVDPLCAARLGGLMGLLVGLLALPFLYLRLVVRPEGLGFSAGVVLLEPLLVSGIGFAFAVSGCLLFNWLAARFGGLEVEFRDADGFSRG